MSKYCVARLTSASLLVLLLLFPHQICNAQRATVSESSRTFRTYAFDDPDPVPGMSNIYPYFRFQGYSRYPEDRKWKVVTLENPYIRVLLAPEIGGKILGAFEKSTGKAFIYFNKVVKFREIAMRGPWTSGGIEFNFGDIGHTPATATPVDYVTRTNPDGSVSCIVGSLDLPSRTEWRVEIRLPRDKAFVETRSHWYNPTAYPTSLYHWMNAAADADSDLQFIYPGTGFIGHGGEHFPWPVDAAGRDLSLYQNNAFGSYKSYHVLGSYTDFYAVRYMKDDFGVVHWSPYTDKPGKKIWIWGLSREGEIWRDLLTDPDLGNKQYVEIQSGLLFNQAAPGSTLSPFKHREFTPHSSEIFSEAWFPFTGIGGAVAANLHGVLNVRRTRGQLVIGFCPLEQVDTRLTVSTTSGRLYEKRLRLKPLQPFVDSLLLPLSAQATINVADCISYRTDDDSLAELHRPMVSPQGYDWGSVNGLFTDATERARQRDYRGALQKFTACLQKDSFHVPALAGMADVSLRRMEYEQALAFARRALSIDAYDPDVNFIYGVTNRALGRFADAMDGYGVAARAMKYRVAASVELAEVLFLQQRFAMSESYAQRALEYDRRNVRALRLVSLLARLHGNSHESRRALTALGNVDPLDHFGPWEECRREPTPQRLQKFRSGLRGELSQESILELASYYGALGLEAETLKLLREARKHPLALYWMAYLKGKSGDHDESRRLLDSALAASPYLIFPHRAELLTPLRWSLEARPHWKTQYYIALLYWSRGCDDRAGALLDACGYDPDYPSFYLARGLFRRVADSNAALEDYRKALEIGPEEWRTHAALTDFLNERGDFTEALTVADNAARQFPARYVLQCALARTLLFNGLSARSLAILDTLTILPFEGARYGREAFRHACLLEAARALGKGNASMAIRLADRAREWPERLGGGKPYAVDERLEDYIAACASEKLGDRGQRDAFLGRIRKFAAEHPIDASPLQLITALAEESLISRVAGQEVIDRWLQADPSSDGARWASATYARNVTVARRLEHDLRSTVLHRASGNQEFVLLVDVVALLTPPPDK